MFLRLNVKLTDEHNACQMESNESSRRGYILNESIFMMYMQNITESKTKNILTQ